MPCAASASPDDDHYAAGYATGYLEQEYGVSRASVTVSGGLVAVSARELRPAERESAAKAFLSLPAVTAVRFDGDSRVYDRANTPLPFMGSRVRVFPRRLLFEPLIADPHWPHLSATVQHFYRRDVNLVFYGNLGESFPLFSGGTEDRPWQFGLQGAVFTTWDMKARHDDQLTDDFLFGLPFSWRTGKTTWMARIYHISTHTGDEFLLHHPDFNRIKVSYEAVDLRASYDLGEGWRAYGGPGYMYRRFPLEMKPLIVQAGFEYLHPQVWLRHWRPVLALDLQKHQEYGWGATDISARAGFQVEHRNQPSRRVLILLEYFRGRDPNGQFYYLQTERLGLGLHLFF